ncbi:MAG: MATE family efflux transporter [Hominenteromicrobium sp.]
MEKIQKIKPAGFSRALAAVVLPIALQNLISSAVSAADALMLGSVDQNAMSAVSLAGQITFVLTLFYMGLATGAGVLTAQYWGKGDTRTIERVLQIALLPSVLISALFCVFSLAVPELLMRIFTKDEALVALGASYQRILAVSYLAMGISQIYLSVVKSMENARLSACITSSSLLVNIALNAVSVFVLFPGQPEKALCGIAAATVIARLAELLWCLLHMALRSRVRLRVPRFDAAQRQLSRDFLRYTAPVLGNYVLWGSALAATSAIMGHVSSDLVAANSIASTIKSLAVVLCVGIGSGGSVLIGKYLGKGELGQARYAGDRLCLYAIVFGVLAGLSVLLVGPLLFRIVRLNDTAAQYLHDMLFVCAYYCIGKSFNSSVIGGIFCAGGDAKFGFLCDTIVMWGIILPLGLLSAFVWHLHPVALYVVLTFDEIIKLPVAFIRYKQYKWLNNLTRDFDQNPETERE